MIKQLFVLLLFLIVYAPVYGQSDSLETDSDTSSNTDINLIEYEKIEQLEQKLDSVQSEVLKTRDHVDKLFDRNKIQIGVSIGYNYISNNDVSLYDAYISPIDSTLKLEMVNYGSIVLSTTVMVTPFDEGFTKQIKNLEAYKENRGKFTRGLLFLGQQCLKYGKNISFIASVNLKEFSSFSEDLNFNKRIDGGLGLGYKFSDSFWIGATYEQVSLLQPREALLLEDGNKLPGENGSFLTQLDKTNTNYFNEKVYSAVSLKFIYTIK